MAEHNQSVPLPLRVLGVALFLGVGACLVGWGLGVLPLLGGELSAPPWVATLAGAVFLLGGIFIALDAAPGRAQMLRNLVIIAVLVLLAVLFSWLAFVPGERNFSASMSAAGYVRGTVPESEGRFMFGALAILSYVLIIAALVKAWRGTRASW